MKINQQYPIKRNSNSLLQKLVLSLIVISIAPFCFASQGAFGIYAQNEQKIIKLAPSINPQLKFSEAKVGSQDRKFGESFNAEADWVKNLSFKLESIADKPIVYLQVNVNFPETRATGNLMSYGINFGQRPDSKFKQPNKPMLLKPSETLEVSLGKEKDKITKFINERQPIESILKVELEIGMIIFEDKTAWNAGTFLRQDTNNPDRYNPIGSELPR